MAGNPLIRVKDDDGYVDKLVKMVPAEAISAYLALINIAGASARGAGAGNTSDAVSATTSAIANFWGNPLEVWWAFLIGLFILAVARIFGSITVGEQRMFDLSRVDWIMVFISGLAFCLWVYTIGGDTSGPFKGFYSLFWGTALIILFTFLAPYVHGGSTRLANKILGQTKHQAS